MQGNCSGSPRCSSSHSYSSLSFHLSSFPKSEILGLRCVLMLFPSTIYNSSWLPLSAGVLCLLCFVVLFHYSAWERTFSSSVLILSVNLCCTQVCKMFFCGICHLILQILWSIQLRDYKSCPSHLLSHGATSMCRSDLHVSFYNNSSLLEKVQEVDI